MIEAWFDGAFLWDEGHAAYGAIVKQDGETVFSESKYMGASRSTLSVNCAEYAGLIAVLKFLISIKAPAATIYGDSRMVIMQMGAGWKMRGGTYGSYFIEARQLRNQLPPLNFKWIPREKNWEADALSKEPLKRFYFESRQTCIEQLDEMFERAISK